MTLPLYFLSFGAIFFGFMARDLVIGFGSTTFGNSLYNNIFNFNLVEAEFLSSFLKNLPFFATLLGIILATILINAQLLSKNFIYSLKMSKTYRFFYVF
jgi:NADH-ubiquinone oxidoreductase chain 5